MLKVKTNIFVNVFLVVPYTLSLISFQEKFQKMSDLGYKESKHCAIFGSMDYAKSELFGCVYYNLHDWYMNLNTTLGRG